MLDYSKLQTDDRTQFKQPYCADSQLYRAQVYDREGILSLEPIDVVHIVSISAVVFVICNEEGRSFLDFVACSVSMAGVALAMSL